MSVLFLSAIPHTLVLLPRNQKIRCERKFIFNVLKVSIFGRCPKYTCIGQRQEDNSVLSPEHILAGSWLAFREGGPKVRAGHRHIHKEWSHSLSVIVATTIYFVPCFSDTPGLRLYILYFSFYNDTSR